MINIPSQNLEEYFSVIIQNNLENKKKKIQNIFFSPIMPSITVGIGDDAIRLSGDGYFNLNKALYEILKNPAINDTFTIEELDSLLIGFFQDKEIGKILPEDKIIKRLVSEFLIFLDKQLQENKSKKYSFVFPIENLKINENKWRLGQVTFFSYGGYKDLIEEIRKPELQKKDYLFFRGVNENSVFALTEAEGSNKKAKEKAVSKVNEEIDILRLYFTNWHGHARSQIVRKGESALFDEEFLSFNKEGIIRSSGWAGAGYPMPCEINQNILDLFELYKLSKVGTILNKDTKKRNAFEKQLIGAVRWFGYGVVNPNNNHRIIMYITALETILGTKDTETYKDKSIGNAIGEKGAFILGHNCETRLDIKNRLKQLYNYRSKILHQGRLEDNEAKVAELEKLTSSVLLRLIDLSTEFNSMEDFDNYIKKQLFSTPWDR